MAQYFTDFSSDSIGDQPANTTFKRDSATGDYTKQENLGDPVLRYLVTSGGVSARGLSYDSADSSGSTEFLTNIINPDVSASGRVVLFASESPESEYGCYVNPGSSFSTRLAVYERVSGSFSLLATSSFPSSGIGHYNIRFRVTPGSPNQIKMRAWADGASEPATWNIETTSSALSLTTGWSGTVGFGENQEILYTRVGIGTNGDSAPTSAAQIPVSLAASNITDTSALLGWERG